MIEFEIKLINYPERTTDWNAMMRGEVGSRMQSMIHSETVVCSGAEGTLFVLILEWLPGTRLTSKEIPDFQPIDGAVYEYNWGANTIECVSKPEEIEEEETCPDGYIWCPTCDGEAFVNCKKCHGAGEIECKKCRGDGWVKERRRRSWRFWRRR